MSITYRDANPFDVPAILGLIKELALFEKAPEKVENTEAQLLEDGFGQFPIFKAIVAQHEDTIVAFALSYFRYSTWRGKVVFLEDLYVKPEYRSKGIGRKLMEMKLAYTEKLGLKYLCLQVLDWNQPAIDFYKSWGAELDEEWINVLFETEKISLVSG